MSLHCMSLPLNTIKFYNLFYMRMNLDLFINVLNENIICCF